MSVTHDRRAAQQPLSEGGVQRSSPLAVPARPVGLAVGMGTVGLALLTSMMDSAHLHAQSTAGWRGRKASWFALAG